MSTSSQEYTIKSFDQLPDRNVLIANQAKVRASDLVLITTFLEEAIVTAYNEILTAGTSSTSFEAPEELNHLSAFSIVYAAHEIKETLKSKGYLLEDYNNKILFRVDSTYKSK